MDYDKFVNVYIQRREDKKRFDYNRDIETPTMFELLGDVKEKSILDIGCGFGYHAQHLSKKRFKKFVGFDLCKAFVEYAKNLNIKNSNFYVHDMSKKFPQKDKEFDIVFASLSVHYVKNLKKLFKEVNRVLKKGGTFIFSTGHPVFCLMNENDQLIGVQNRNTAKQKIRGNYFNEEKRKSNLGSLGLINLYTFTYETLIKSLLQTGFKITDYVDAKPTPQSKKYNKKKYEITTNLPTFIFFKAEKI